MKVATGPPEVWGLSWLRRSWKQGMFSVSESVISFVGGIRHSTARLHDWQATLHSVHTSDSDCVEAPADTFEFHTVAFTLSGSLNHPHSYR